MRINKTALSTLALSCVLLQSCATEEVRTQEVYQKAKKDFSDQKYTQAFREIQGPAKAGIPDAQYALGYMYYYGKGVIENRGLAEYWFEKAAKQGQPDAIRALKLLK